MNCLQHNYNISPPLKNCAVLPCET